MRRITKNNLILICPLEKRYKWGMNYHVQFFNNSKNLLILLERIKPAQIPIVSMKG